MEQKRKAIILAAGKGTRMNSERPKILHEIAGKSMIHHVCETVAKAGFEEVYVVVGHKKEQVQGELTGNLIVQEPQLGTGHGVDVCREALEGYTGTVLVTHGDTPLFTPETLEALVAKHQKTGAKATVITTYLANPKGYGRVCRDASKAICRIVEQKDATEEERAICEVNTGTYCFDAPLLFHCLKNIARNNVQGEYYLPDVLPLMIQEGHRVESYVLDDPRESLGINDRIQLAEAEKVMQERLRAFWMLQGVTMQDPASVYLHQDVELSCDTFLYPNVILEGRTRVGKNCTLGPNVRLVDTRVGAHTKIEQAVAVECVVGNSCLIGPFAYLRPKTTLGDFCKVGDFVELKNAQVASHSKIPHLSYVGDAIVGQRVNIGCGTITCNYDGKNKHTTVIEDGVFVGSNTNLVAPVTLREGSFVAAGSTITKDVPKDALGIARAKQTVKEDWAAKRNP